MLRNVVLRLERDIFRLLNWNQSPKPALAFVTTNTENDVYQKASDILDSIFESFLWGAPKSRRSTEKRKMRKMSELKHYEHARPKKNIIACLQCGHYHENDTICGNCYDKVRQETKLMQKAFEEDLRYSAPLQEVVVLYENEKEESIHDKYVVKVKKTRPSWFAKNLLIKAK
ncbi:39S ribosomal protein L32, mitochondrial [Octopus sinensis]|uniref:Large ribosomal subunit protein bL32m n=1 Tax=Octopus sinensis TaxID=2607531 RepID=A0A6P7SC09_9MOLL|nr:39S ribosomal protein L32, mitochondrial [Octopus sinensis]